MEPQLFANDPNTFVYGMLASLLAAAAWLSLASYFGWPVSTTHSIVGAILGFGVTIGGIGAIKWGVVVGIVGSWIITPFIAAVLAYLVFSLILRLIFYASDPVRAAQRATPILTFCVFFVMALVTVFKGLKPLHFDELSIETAVAIATGVGLIAGGASWAFVVWRNKKQPLAPLPSGGARVSPAPLEKAARHLRRVQLASNENTAQELGQLVRQVKHLERDARAETSTDNNPELHEVYRRVERIFVFLQIISASFVAFAHGSNDVANAIGPLAAVLATLHPVTDQAGALAEGSATVSSWVLALGGVGIVIGLATWGWRMIETIGKRITELTPSRGFAAEFAAATTIVIASRFSMPISTTQTLVGAVLGVGVARGISALNLNTIRDIVVSWVITLPAGAFLAILFFYILNMIFG